MIRPINLPIRQPCENHENRDFGQNIDFLPKIRIFTKLPGVTEDLIYGRKWVPGVSQSTLEAIYDTQIPSGRFLRNLKKSTFLGIFDHFFSHYHHRPMEISIPGRKSAKWFWDHGKDTLKSFQTQRAEAIRRSHHSTPQYVKKLKKRDFRVFRMQNILHPQNILMGQKFLPSKSLEPEDYFTYLQFSHISRRSKVIVLQSSKIPPFLGFLSIHHIYIYIYMTLASRGGPNPLKNETKWPKNGVSVTFHSM